MKHSKHKDHHLLHIGLRKMKSLLAILVGFFVWQLIRIFAPGLEVHPIYIYIYGMLEIRETAQKTVNMGKTRIKATFIGLGIGVLFLFLTALLESCVHTPWMLTAVDLGMILLGTLLVLCVAEVAGCKPLCAVAAAIFIILQVSYSQKEPISYAVLRSLQTIIAVCIAWLINVKLFPYAGPKPQEDPAIPEDCSETPEKKAE